MLCSAVVDHYIRANYYAKGHDDHSNGAKPFACLISTWYDDGAKT